MATMAGIVITSTAVGTITGTFIALAAMSTEITTALAGASIGIFTAPSATIIVIFIATAVIVGAIGAAIGAIGIGTFFTIPTATMVEAVMATVRPAGFSARRGGMDLAIAKLKVV